MIKIRKYITGKNAYKISRVWRLGFHIFLNDTDLIFRCCYLRNKKGTHYIQCSIKVRSYSDVEKKIKE